MRKVAGVGVNDMPRGWLNATLLNRAIYNRWSGMLNRCYNPKDPGYKWYGARGYYVEDCFHRLSVYVDVVKSLPNYNDFKKNPSLYHIDKDFKQAGSIKHYGPDTIQIILRSVNEQDGLSRVDYDKVTKGRVDRHFKPIKGVNLTTGEIRIYKYATEASSDGFNRGHLSECLNGGRSQTGGFRWEYISKEEYLSGGGVL